MTCPSEVGSPMVRMFLAGERLPISLDWGPSEYSIGREQRYVLRRRTFAWWRRCCGERMWRVGMEQRTLNGDQFPAGSRFNYVNSWVTRKHLCLNCGYLWELSR